jgi:hypothetical protein
MTVTDTPKKKENFIRSHLKIRILVPYQGGREIQAGGIRWYFEDLK